MTQIVEIQKNKDEDVYLLRKGGAGNVIRLTG